MLLDLNLPRMNGCEVLAAVKGDPALATIPVVVPTTSDADDDILSSYKLHANAYFTKPSTTTASRTSSIRSTTSSSAW